MVIAGIGALVWVGIRLPPIQSLEIPKRPPSVLIVGANGATLATRGDMGGAAVQLRELPDYVPKAFIAIEDRRFYSHHGVDPVRHHARAHRRRSASRRLARRFDDHAATGQKSVPDPGTHRLAQAAGNGAGVLARTQIFQSADSRALSQPRLFRLRRLRHRRGRAALLRQIGAASDACRSSSACRPRAIAVAAGADPQSGRGRAPGARRAHRHGGAKTDRRGRRARLRLRIPRAR